MTEKNALPACLPQGILWTCLFFLFSISAFSQGSRLVLDDSLYFRGTAVHELLDGSVLLGGTCEAPSLSLITDNAFITRLDSGLNPLWTRSFGGSSFTSINTMAELPNGNIVCGGLNVDSFLMESNYGFLAFLDTNGSLLSALHTGDALPVQDIQIFGMDSILTTGALQPAYNTGIEFVSRSRHTINGTMVSNSKAVHGVISGIAIGTTSTLLSDLGILGTGYHYDAFVPANQGLIVSRTDANGNILWVKSFAVSGQEWGASPVEMPDSTFMIAGRDILTHTLFLLKLDAAGNEIQTKQLNAPFPVTWEKAIAADNGDLVVAGNFGAFGLGFLACLDSALNVKWAHRAMVRMGLARICC